MAKLINRLSALGVQRKRKRGYYADGNGLYLQIAKGGAKSWVYRFTLDGKAREMGLGSVNTVELGEARDKARDCRKLIDKKIDPIRARNEEETTRRIAEAGQLTFDECAESFVKARRTGWRNKKHARQWETT
ncbi:MAG: Arm DNA-binding domain-containing protein, partial [Gammaproteobacteria bacterium]|nr:Arm DNA-binding domain-containing protein [Gammaproteobacteria bacterium]